MDIVFVKRFFSRITPGNFGIAGFNKEREKVDYDSSKSPGQDLSARQMYVAQAQI